MTIIGGPMTTDDPRPAPSLLDPFRQSLILRLIGLCALILTLQIPIGMINGTIGERRTSRTSAIASATYSWGRRQIVRGPVLVVPYVRRWVTPPATRKDKATIREDTEQRYVLPEALTVDGTIETEVRHRGLFAVPLYVARLALTGTMHLPQASDFPSNTVSIGWDRATLAIGVEDPRAIRDTAVIEWDGRPVSPEPGVAGVSLLDRGFKATVATPAEHAAGSTVTFAVRTAVAGSDGFSVLPLGSETTIRLASPWPDPSFDGAYLPAERTVGPKGFGATWRVSELARNFPASWKAGDVGLKQLDETLLGVSLLTPVDAYRTTERAVKYEILFVGLTFVTFFLFELLAGLRVHPVQYLLTGLALCLFYLLLLSLTEHTGFVLAYTLAATSIAGLVTAYGRAVLKTRARTAALAALVTSLYVYLFVLLHIEDYALLVGSIGLFLILATIMFLTRRVDWYSVQRRVVPSTREATEPVA
jgi:inner membrane protein